MLKDIGFKKKINNCTLTFIGMYCILMITSTRFFKSNNIILNLENITWVLQLYLFYIYFSFGRENHKWVNLFLTFLIPYLVLTTADMLNTTEIIMPIYLCLTIFILSISFYIYLNWLLK